MHADRIIVLDDGCITEAGTHQELLELDGKYASLFRLQRLDPDTLRELYK